MYFGMYLVHFLQDLIKMDRGSTISEQGERLFEK
jgi:hypothetical protein